MRVLPGLLPAILLALSACTGDGAATPERIEVPDGTGDLSIDMTGEWTFRLEEVLDEVYAYGGGPSGRETGVPFVPPTTGTVVTVQAGMLLDADGRDMTDANCRDPYSELFSYLNSADGRFLRYDRGCRSRPDPNIADGGSGRVQIAVGTAGPDRLEGLLAIENAGFLPGDIPLRGLYRVVFER